MKNEYLIHFGVPGMKWGVRKNIKNANYSDKQRAYDRKIYGRGSERRINKRMNKGEGIKSARHSEVSRRQGKLKTKKLGRATLRSSHVQALIPVGIAALAAAGIGIGRNVALRKGKTNIAFKNYDKVINNLKTILSSDTSSFGGSSNLGTDFIKTLF